MGPRASIGVHGRRRINTHTHTHTRALTLAGEHTISLTTSSSLALTHSHTHTPKLMNAYATLCAPFSLHLPHSIIWGTSTFGITAPRLSCTGRGRCATVSCGGGEWGPLCGGEFECIRAPIWWTLCCVHTRGESSKWCRHLLAFRSE